ncbi:MAG: amidohydrolase [Candidatus Aegiribacteria sp.]|nr:amidohydrolase [Candidatus Aegiribacteria sp.]
MNQKQYQELIRIRQHLHSIPELSGKESSTAEYLKALLLGCNPDNLITELGGTGIAAVFNGPITGPRILLRCDMDAIPVLEKMDLPYSSTMDGISHKCGHDGHMAIMAGIAKWLSENRPDSGSVVLLFQPAEETGEGAIRVLKDPRFQDIMPDFVFALHNLPGFPIGSIILRTGIFASASRGMVIELSGSSSHAAEPDLGRSPALAIALMIQTFNDFPASDNPMNDLANATITHARIGEPVFGTSPGKGLLMVTLRSGNMKAMKSLSQRSEDSVREIANSCELNVQISWTEEFPLTENSENTVDLVRTAAEYLGLEIIQPDKPFPWSEDFGHFTMSYPGTLFGIGAGIHSSALHSPEYDFPDELITTGVNVFRQIIEYYSIK